MGFEEAKDGGAERASNESLRFIWIVEEPNLQRNQTIWTKVDPLGQFVRRPVPDIQMLAVMTCK